MYGMEIFPLNSDQIADGDINYSGMTYNARPCKLCGGLVLKSFMNKHIEWHNELLTIRDM